MAGQNDQRYDDQQGQWAEDGYDLRGGHHYGDDYDRQRYGQPQSDQGYEAEYDQRAYAPNPEEPYGYDDDGNPLYYQQEPRALKSSGRSGMLMVGAVLAVAIVGSAGAVGYKMLGSHGFGGEPPLIKADTEPVKTVPEKSAETQQNKAIYDRVEGGAPAKSKVVSREEEPVDLPRAPASEPRPDGSRIILPGGTASTETTPPSTNGSEPRRVKTMAIRPDQPIAPQAAAPQMATPQIPAPQPVAPAQVAQRSDPIAETARTGQAPRGSEFDNGIISDGDSPRLAAAPTRPAAPAPAPRPAAPQPAAPVARSTPAPAPTPAPTAPRSDPQQVAAVAPRAPAPAATAAAQPRPSAGGFVVQVTSQRSEVDARSAYANLQKRYPSVLGPYQPSIQTATVGDRGVYYRVRVGPFGSSTDASTVCNNLRTAGGDCVVARN